MTSRLGILAIFLCSAVLADPARVTVLPLQEMGETPASNWVAKAVRQSLSDELAQMPGVEVTSAPTTQPIGDIAGALKQAGELKARFAIFASLQHVDGQLRVTGQIADASTGKSIGGLKATATERELFTLEDSLADQVKRVLRDQLPQVPPPLPAPVVNNPPAQQAPVVPLRRIFDGSDLQRAMNDPRPILAPPHLFYDDGGDDFVDFTPLYSVYPIYTFISIDRFDRFCFPRRFQHHSFNRGGSITPRMNNSTRGQGLVAGYMPMTTSYVPQTQGVSSRSVSGSSVRGR